MCCCYYHPVCRCYFLPGNYRRPAYYYCSPAHLCRPEHYCCYFRRFPRNRCPDYIRLYPRFPDGCSPSYPVLQYCLPSLPPTACRIRSRSLWSGISYFPGNPSPAAQIHPDIPQTGIHLFPNCHAHFPSIPRSDRCRSPLFLSFPPPL